MTTHPLGDSEHYFPANSPRDSRRPARTAHRLASLIAALLMLSACTNDADQAPTGTVPTALPTVEATEEPTDEPLTMTVEEANEILAELSTLQGDIFRILIATREVAPEAIERLEAAFTGPALESGREALPQFIEQDPELEFLPGGDPVRRADSIMQAGEACVTVMITQDMSPAIEGSPPRHGATALVPGEPDDHNPSGWRIAREYLAEAEEEVQGDPCSETS